jgi:hypothetical protein
VCQVSARVNGGERMSLTIDISIEQDTATSRLDAIGAICENPGEQLRAAASAVYEFVKEYHIEFGNRWRGDHYMAGPHSGEWQQAVAEAWQPPILISDVDGASAIVENTHPHLAFKIEGGTIVPVSAGALTIPLVPEAKGISAREYAESQGVQLFAIKGVLATVGTSRGKVHDIVPIYALKQSVTQEPWPGAMPPNEEIRDVFAAAFQLQLEPVLEGAPA